MTLCSCADAKVESQSVIRHKQLGLTLYFWPMIGNCEQASANLSQTAALGCWEAWIGLASSHTMLLYGGGRRQRGRPYRRPAERNSSLVLECHAEMKSELLATTKLEITSIKAAGSSPPQRMMAFRETLAAERRFHRKTI